MHDDHCVVLGYPTTSFIHHFRDALHRWFYVKISASITLFLRRWSDRRFPYGHLVTTFPSLLASSSI